MFVFLKKYEKVIILILSGMMALVLGLSTLDLGWLIFQDIIKPPMFLLSVDELLEIFGLFMLVVIGIELLETIMKTYLLPGQAHYEVVLSVAIIAIARKVIILDLKKTESLSLIGIATIIIALTVGYYLMKRCQKEKSDRGKIPADTKSAEQRPCTDD
ncbi:MAG: phosphate-starvation-inducible PsiE family protein [Anaerolineales bacterium]|nr:phosphate-starvation-inducible PsiE family protein [Anaerolineales bacterium]